MPLFAERGNPAPGPKFDFKLRWFERLATHAKALLDTGAPIALAGDYNVMPTDLDVYKPERWVDDELSRPEVRTLIGGSSPRAGLTQCGHSHPGERVYTFWDYFRKRSQVGTLACELITSCSAPPVGPRLTAAGVDRDGRGWEKASDHAPTWIELANAKSTASSSPCKTTEGQSGRSSSILSLRLGASGWCRRP